MRVSFLSWLTVSLQQGLDPRGVQSITITIHSHFLLARPLTQKLTPQVDCSPQPTAQELREPISHMTQWAALPPRNRLPDRRLTH
jgi:hypothetical protein